MPCVAKATLRISEVETQMTGMRRSITRRSSIDAQPLDPKVKYQFREVDDEFVFEKEENTKPDSRKPDTENTDGGTSKWQTLHLAIQDRRRPSMPKVISQHFGKFPGTSAAEKANRKTGSAASPKKVDSQLAYYNNSDLLDFSNLGSQAGGRTTRL